MNGDQFLSLLLIIGGCLLALYIILMLVTWIGIGALNIFLLAASGGPVGIATYVILWVFAFPVMAVICGIAGFANRVISDD